jgi:serpin B
MRLQRLIWSSAAALAVVGGCGDGTAPGAPPELLTSLPRALSTEEQGIIGANNAFTLALFQKASAAEPGKNVFMSPLSASIALGMTMNGARNGTLDAMRTAMQYGTMSQADINAGYKSLMSLILGLDPTVEARIANSIWYRNTLPINPAFVAAGQDYFAAEVSALDFTKSTAALGTINGWVNDKTAGRIPTILDEIRQEEVMFLINAIYFKASWRNTFDRAATQDASFTSGTGTVQTVPMMYLKGEADTFRGREWADGTMSVELPYGNAAFNMQVYLPPDTSTVESFVGRLTADQLMNPGSQLARLDLWMPRVKLEYKRRLNEDLAALGMGIAFTDNADFGGMVTTPIGLAISNVLQKTFLSIDEEGTEAAAVTSVGIRITSAPPSLSMRCDRPYVVVIREKLSGTIVFIGKINSI